MRIMMRILVLLVLIFFNSCTGNKKDNQIAITVNQEANAFEILCFYKTLNGEKEIYKISGKYLYSFGERKQIPIKLQDSLYPIPDDILKNNNRLGCGTCIDSMDYKFIFKNDNTTKTWEIQSGYDIPEPYKYYFDLLINISIKQSDSF